MSAFTHFKLHSLGLTAWDKVIACESQDMAVQTIQQWWENLPLIPTAAIIQYLISNLYPHVLLPIILDDEFVDWDW